MVRAAIEAERYRIGPRVKRLRLLLAKLETEPENPAAYPPPMPSAQPSLIYAKLTGAPVEALARAWTR